MCNLSIIFSRVSDEYKTKKLKPLHEKGKKTNPKNYRLISILPIIFKILEIVIHNQTMDFINKKNFIQISISFSKISLERFLPLVFTRYGTKGI